MAGSRVSGDLDHLSAVAGGDVTASRAQRLFLAGGEVG